MALTRITKGVIKPNENYDTHNINSTGIVTAIGLDVNGNGDISGNLSVGGVLTYEDVTSIDSVGIITAQKDIHVGGGVSAIGVGTFSGLDISGDIDVDGHTNLDNVSIAGVTTTTGILFNNSYIKVDSTQDQQLNLNSTDNGAVYMALQRSGTRKAWMGYGSNTSDLTLRNEGSDGDLYLSVNDGGTQINPIHIDASENGKVNITKDLDVDGHTNLDNVSIAGVTTFSVGPIVPNGQSYRGIINSGSQTKIIGGYISGSDTLRLGETMYLTSNGLGIGESSPEEELHITAATPVIRLEDSDTSRQSQIVGIDGNLRFDADNNNAQADTNISFRTDGSEKLRIDKDGILWVNYGNPQSSSLMILDKGGSGEAAIRFYNASSNKAQIALDSDEQLTFDVNGSERLRITSDGAIGIGNLQTAQTTTTHTSATKLYIDSTKFTKIARLAKTNITSAGWFTVAKIASSNGNHFKCYASIGGDFTQDMCVMELTGAFSASGALNNTYAEPVFKAHRVSAHSTDRITRARFVKDASNLTYLQIYIAGGVNNNTWGKSVLEYQIGAYSQNNADTNSAAMFEAGGSVTNIRTLEIDDNAICVNAGSHKFYSGGNATESLNITSAGNVGINRINPDQRLNVSGNIELNAHDNANGSGGYYTSKGLIIGNAYDAGKASSVTDDRNAIIWQERGLDLDIGTNNTLRMKITYDGKVGIGTDNPNNPLTIHGSGNHIYLKDTATNNILQIRHSGGVAEFNSFDLDGSTRRDFVFNQYATEVLRIDSSGRLKVGDNVRPASDANEGAGLRVTSSLTRNQYYSPHGHYFGSIGYADNTNTKAWLAVDSGYAQSSAVSAGIFLSAFHQDAGGSDCGYTIKNLKDGYALVFSRVKTAASVNNPAVEEERLRIASDGNVMVGNGADTPYAPLHVYAENGRGLNAIFGKGFVDHANYHYDDANIQLNGRDVDGNDTGSGIEFNSRNTANSNWLHGAITQDRSGNLNFINGGAGTAVGTAKLIITAGGQVQITGGNTPLKVTHTGANCAEFHRGSKLLGINADWGGNTGDSVISVTDNFCVRTNSNSERFTINSAGNVAIANEHTSIPSKLWIYEGSNDAYVRVQRGSTSNVNMGGYEIASSNGNGNNVLARMIARGAANAATTGSMIFQVRDQGTNYEVMRLMGSSQGSIKGTRMLVNGNQVCVFGSPLGTSGTQARDGNINTYNTVYEHSSSSYRTNDNGEFGGTFAVGGNADRWYPVWFSLPTNCPPQELWVNKYVHNYATWDGTLAFRASLSGTGYGAYTVQHRVHFYQSSAKNFIGKILYTSHNNAYLVLWMRGGGRSYGWGTTGGNGINVNVGDDDGSHNLGAGNTAETYITSALTINQGYEQAMTTGGMHQQSDGF